LHGRVLTRVSKLLAEATTGDGTLRLPRFVMARILSMRPETLSRALKELEQRGAITLKPRLKIVNPELLRQAIVAH
jgi:DNA-binding transcriptional regulator YhcF (GntR family)